jgi:hypothetical protein
MGSYIFSANDRVARSGDEKQLPLPTARVKITALTGIEQLFLS